MVRKKEESGAILFVLRFRGQPFQAQQVSALSLRSSASCRISSEDKLLEYVIVLVDVWVYVESSLFWNIDETLEQKEIGIWLGT